MDRDELLAAGDHNLAQTMRLYATTVPGAALGFLLGGLSLPAMSLGGFVAGIATALISAVVARFTAMREDASFAAAYLTSLIGARLELLMERDRLGRTPSFAEMELNEAGKPGELITARVVDSDGKRLHGEKVTAGFQP